MENDTYFEVSAEITISDAAFLRWGVKEAILKAPSFLLSHARLFWNTPENTNR